MNQFRLQIVWLFLVVIYLGNSQKVDAQYIDIPDLSFKSYLLNNPAINTNGDGQIQDVEASLFNGAINVNYNGISDLTGIEAFTSLKYLYCEGNSLDSLDLSSNLMLRTLNCSFNWMVHLNVSNNVLLDTLECHGNLLNSLDLTNCSSLEMNKCSANIIDNLILPINPSLKVLICGQNYLTYLDLSNDTLLSHLSCDHNQLAQLDLSQNAHLEILFCQNNYLSTLDLTNNHLLDRLYCPMNLLTTLNIQNGNNSNIIFFNSTNNPNLSCIQVDSIDLMNNNWNGNKDPNTIFSLDCTTSIFESGNSSKSDFVIFPNPNNGIFSIEITSNHNANNWIISVNSLMGEKVIDYNFKNSKTIEMDLTSLAFGTYFISLSDGNNKLQKRVVIVK